MQISHTLITSFVLSVAALFGFYYLAFPYQFGAPIPASYDVANWMIIKEKAAARAVGSRVLLIGDSSTLFGMDSSFLAQELGLSVINMALHGGLSLDWLTTYAQRHARTGDIVVMPLAWTYYYRDFEEPEDWIVEQIIAWNREYFDSMEVMTKLRYMTAISPTNLIKNISAKDNRAKILQDYPRRRILTYDEVLKEYAEKNPVGDKIQPYSFVNLNPYGDMQHACGNAKGPLSSFALGNDKSSSHRIVLPKILNLLRATSNFLAARGVKMVIAPSITLADDKSLNANYKAHTQKIFDELKGAGITTIGSPIDFYFPASAFYDTNLHLECGQNTERARRLATAIRPLLKGITSP
jgi:hypothetical protein